MRTALYNVDDQLVEVVVGGGDVQFVPYLIQHVCRKLLLHVFYYPFVALHAVLSCVMSLLPCGRVCAAVAHPVYYTLIRSVWQFYSPQSSPDVSSCGEFVSPLFIIKYSSTNGCVVRREPEPGMRAS